MATFTAIPEKTQSATAMKRVIYYVMRTRKPCITVSSLSAVRTVFLNQRIRSLWLPSFNNGKANGVFFKQYVKSFKQDCNATPQQIHHIGLELVKAFDGFEVVVATHIDRDH